MPARRLDHHLVGIAQHFHAGLNVPDDLVSPVLSAAMVAVGRARRAHPVAPFGPEIGRRLEVRPAARLSARWTEPELLVGYVLPERMRYQSGCSTVPGVAPVSAKARAALIRRRRVRMIIVSLVPRCSWLRSYTRPMLLVIA